MINVDENGKHRWDLYNIHRAEGMFRHPNPELTPEVLRAWYNKFYREFYSPFNNPGYALWKIRKSMGDGSFLRNVGYAAKTFFPRLFPASPLDNIRAGMKEAARHQQTQLNKKTP